ncbi:MAG: arylesterase [Rhodospirillales bacterium]|nr:arylesterase [Rhodospirillales bacterium]
MAQPAAPRLLVLGDSLSAGYGLPADQGFEAQLGAALAAAHHPVRIVDGAVSGDTSAGGLARLDWVLTGGVDAAIVELGANDGLRGLPTADLEKNLGAILDRLAAHHIPVLLAGMLAPPNLGAEYGAAFRAVYAKLGQRPGVIFYPFFMDGAAGHPDLIQADGLHPNAAGVRIEVARILPDVLRLLAAIPARRGS